MRYVKAIDVRVGEKFSLDGLVFFNRVAPANFNWPNQSVLGATEDSLVSIHPDNMVGIQDAERLAA